MCIFKSQLIDKGTNKVTKEAYIKEVANKWKGQIDPRVYEALMNCQV